MKIVLWSIKGKAGRLASKHALSFLFYIESESGRCPDNPQPFEKGWRKLLTTLTESFCSSAIDIAVYGESVVGGRGAETWVICMVFILTAVLVCRGEFREAGGKNAETVSVAEMYTYKNIGV